MNTRRLIKFIWVFIALSGVFSVLFGAWLTHGAQALLESERVRLVTAHHYQIIHTLALLAVVLAHRCKQSRVLLISAILFLMGIMIFCGSLYLKTYSGILAFGSFAPLGGITLAIAWFSLAFIGKEKL